MNYTYMFYKNWHTALSCREPYSKLWQPVVILNRISLLRHESFPLGIFILPVVWTSSNVMNQKELNTGTLRVFFSFFVQCLVKLFWSQHRISEVLQNTRSVIGSKSLQEQNTFSQLNSGVSYSHIKPNSGARKNFTAHATAASAPWTQTPRNKDGRKLLPASNSFFYQAVLTYRKAPQVAELQTSPELWGNQLLHQ